MSEKDTTYNGWTNYETWAVHLWIDSEERTQTAAYEQARECWEDSEDAPQVAQGVWTREQCTRFELAEILQADHTDAAYDLLGTTSGVFSDLLIAALESVNWNEVAQAFIDCIDTEEDEEAVSA